MVLTRLMCEDDIDAVRQIDAAAFGAWRAQLAGTPVDLPRRTRVNILAGLAKDPDGCFVAEEGGQIVGYVFSRTWGSTGWFGPFGVLPRKQGRGIGGQLIAASMGYLRRPGCIVGLETVPESAYNLGLYLRQGFQARFLSLMLTKQLVDAPSRAVPLLRWSLAGAEARGRWLAGLGQAMDRISPGLDCTKEIVIAERMGLGETLIVTCGPEAIGCATLSLSGVREGMGATASSVQIMVLDPPHTDDDTFRTLLEGSEALARVLGKQTLTVPVNAMHTWALDRLLAWGYRVDRTLVRFVLAGTDDGPTTDHFVELGRWAG